MKKKITISWSGGKDSALSLYRILHSSDVEVVGIHTVINEETRRVGMHGIREELIERQADAMDLPLTKLYLPGSEDHTSYTNLMQSYFENCVSNGIGGIVFGDIFLQDLKNFREELLRPYPLQPLFPLWKIRSEEIMSTFLDLGFKTVVCAANAKYFKSSDAGRTIDKSFISELPEDVDCCGENGEYHTFVYEGPIFKYPLKIVINEVVEKTYSYQTMNDNGVAEEKRSKFWFREIEAME
jgi:uncharacterized protein (TIGR00290 family)